MNVTKQKIYPWIMMLCCCGLSMITIGIPVNSIGVFFAPVARTLDAGIGSVSMFSMIQSLAFGFLGPVAIRLIRRHGLRAPLIFGMAGAVACYICMSRVSAVWQLYALAVLLGAFDSLFGPVCISAVTGNWFNRRMGLAAGVAFSFSGISGAVLSPVFNRLIESCGWRETFIIIAVFVAAAAVPIVLLLR